MNPDEYFRIQIMLFQIGEMIEGADFSAFISAIDRADAVGPILDPTAWMQGNQRMHQIREMAVQMREFQRAHQKAEGGDK